MSKCMCAVARRHLCRACAHGVSTERCLGVLIGLEHKIAGVGGMAMRYRIVAAGRRLRR